MLFVVVMSLFVFVVCFCFCSILWLLNFEDWADDGSLAARPERGGLAGDPPEARPVAAAHTRPAHAEPALAASARLDTRQEGGAVDGGHR